MSAERLAELVRNRRGQVLGELLGPGLYYVGGSVRDALGGEAVRDLDFATPLLPDEVRRRLEDRGIRVIPTGLQHQTVTAVVEGEAAEITTFRGPRMAPEGGVVRGGSIEEDLRFRDFTVNAMACPVDLPRLIDPEGGLEDLKARLLRAVGHPEERFREDPLRMMRLVRLTAEKDYQPQPETERACLTLAPLLSEVSVERIRDEFVRILLSPRPWQGVEDLLRLQLLSQFGPELLPMVDCEQNRFHRADVFRHSLEVVQNSPAALTLRLAALLHDVGKPETLSVDPVTGDRHFFLHEVVGAEIAERFLTRLRFPNEVVRSVVLLVRTHMRPLEAGPGGIRRLMRDVGELFAEWRILKETDTSACKIEPEEVAKKFRTFDTAVEEVLRGPPVSPLKSLAIRGNDLLALGIPEGRRIGEILRALHERVLDDPELNERNTLLQLAREMGRVDV